MAKGFQKGHKPFRKKKQDLVFCWTCGDDVLEKKAIKVGDNFYCSKECKKFAEEG